MINGKAEFQLSSYYYGNDCCKEQTEEVLLSHQFFYHLLPINAFRSEQVFLACAK